MNLLLTGATGFIGKYFVRHTQARVTAVSLRSQGLEDSSFEGYDVLVHLAAIVHQKKGSKTHVYDRVNTELSIALARKAKREGVKQFVFMSTVKVYGEESDIPYTEDSPCHPQDDYARSKHKAETELLKLQDNAFTVSIIRTPIVYGHGVKANIKNLVTLTGTIPFLPFAGTMNRRSIVYVGNLCALIDCVIAKRAGGIFLASDDAALSTSDLIAKIGKAIGKTPLLITIPGFDVLLKSLRPSLYRRLYGNLVVDNTATLKKLGFQNPFTTDEGIWLMIHGENDDPETML